jgi:hypothetical protein
VSFDSCHFGEGFDIDEKHPEAWRFAGFSERKGRNAVLTQRAVATYDDYNQPATWDETEVDIKVFEHKTGRELSTIAGDFPQADVRFLTSVCVVISKDDLIQVDGIDYHIEAVLLKRGYKEVWCVRRVG